MTHAPHPLPIGFYFVAGAFLVLTLLAFFTLPETVAVHWNAEGNADGYSDKLVGIALFPIIGLVLFGILRVVPRLDPRAKNIEAFYPEYERFMLVMEGFFLYIFVLFITWNTGMRFSFTTAMIPGFAVLIFYLGMLLEKAKPNYFIGIRTPWTLANDRVWNETHQRTGKLMKIMAIFPLLGLATGSGEIQWMVLPLFATVVYGAVLSYFLYRKYAPKK